MSELITVQHNQDSSVTKKEMCDLGKKTVIYSVATRGYCRSTHLFGQTRVVHGGEVTRGVTSFSSKRSTQGINDFVSYFEKVAGKRRLHPLIPATITPYLKFTVSMSFQTAR